MKKVIQFILAVIFVVSATLGFVGCANNGKLLSTPTGLRVEDGCLWWNPVEYALQYTVSIDGAEYVCSEYQYPIDNVSDGEHTFKVKANGDGILYNTSAFSESYTVELESGAPVSKGAYSQFDEVTQKESFLGYGFDVIKSSLFSDKYINMSFPIFQTDKLMELPLRKVDSKYSLVEETMSSSMEDFMQEWNVKANVNVKWGGKYIGGSVGIKSHYSGGVENAKSNYFHCISITNQKFYIVMQADIDTYRSILSQGFINDLYSDLEPAELFSTYGTHFITSAVMGGKLNSYYLYSSTEEKSYHDVTSKVSTEVRYLAGKTDVTVEGGYKQYAENNNIKVHNTLEVLGGGDFGMTSDEHIAANYQQWEKSLNQHPSLIGIKDSGSLVPIWRLIDSSLDTRTYTWNYPIYDESGAEIGRITGEGSRSQQLQAYFDAYGRESYNSLMESSGLKATEAPNYIGDIRVNNKESQYDRYEVFAGTQNDLSFTVLPATATGYTKTASIVGECDYARIVNSNGVLALEIDANAPFGEVIDIVLSAGSVRESIKVVIQKRCTVDFNSNGGSAVESQTVLYNSQIEQPQNPTKEGFIFAGWYLDSNYAEDSAFPFGRYAITKNMTLYAKWVAYRPKIDYVSSIKGGAPESETVDYNTTISKPSVSLEGYTVVGFYADEDMTVPFDFTKKITRDTTIYIKWKPNTYTVKFDLNGGVTTGKAEVTAEYNTTISPLTCTKEGFDFGGWYKDSACTVQFSFVNNPVEGNMTLYAKWNAYFPTVSYVSSMEGGAPESQKVQYNTLLSRPTVSIEGYTIVGFYSNSDMTELFNFATKKITCDTTIYIKWKINTYTVKFNVNGGVADGKTEVAAEYNTTISSLKCTKPGYEFGGWYKDASFGVQFDFANDRVKGNMTLYAKWANNLVTVKFDSGCGIEVNDRKVEYDTSLNGNLPDIERNGYQLIGWYKDSSCKTAVTAETKFNDNNFAGLLKNGYTTLYAKWEEKIYTIRYHAGEGDLTGDYTTKYTVAMKAIDLPTATYSIYPEFNLFDGWYFDSDYTEKFNDDWKENPRNIDLYAKWDLCTVYYITDTPQRITERCVIIDWSSVSAGIYDADRTIVAENVSRLCFLGNPQTTYANLFIEFFAGSYIQKSQALYLHEFNMIGKVCQASDSAAVDLMINCIGKNSLTAPVDNSAIEKLLGVKFVGFGDMSVTGGDGAQAIVSGGNGGDGKTAIVVDTVTVDMSGKLTVTGGNGANGSAGEDGLDYTDSIASTGQVGLDGGDGKDGGSGGNGASAIKAMTIYAYTPFNCYSGNGGTGGNGGVGGNGGNGGHGWNANGWFNAANGGKGGAGGQGGAGGNGGAKGFASSQVLEVSDLIDSDNITQQIGADGVRGNGGNGGNGGRGGNGGNANGGIGDAGTAGVGGNGGNGGEGYIGGNGGNGGRGGNKGKTSWNSRYFVDGGAAGVGGIGDLQNGSDGVAGEKGGQYNS